MVDSGLSEKEAKDYLLRYGSNEIKSSSKITSFKILLRQIKNNYVVYLLTSAFLISMFIGKIMTAYTIFGVMIIVVFVGFLQEYKAEKSIEALKAMITPTSIVIRSGSEREVPTSEIVPGDLLLLRPGDRVPSDCEILYQKDLKADESILTGESKEIKKSACNETSLPSEVNLLFMGTYITCGKAKVRVLETGMNSRFGKIAGMISEAEKELPLQKKINQVMKYLVLMAIISSISIGIIMFFRTSEMSYIAFTEILVVVLAVCVAAFPEGFPVVLISVLATGAHRMAKKNAIVNRMSIIETLGETTVICSDKTGTITTGEMTVKNIYLNDTIIEVSGAGYDGNGDFSLNGKIIKPAENHHLSLILRTGIVCNDSRIERKNPENEYIIFGSPTEASLLILGAKANMHREDLKDRRVEEISFSSERKMMSVLVNEGAREVVYVKGAPEVILKKCKFIHTAKGISEIHEEDIHKIHTENKNMNFKCFRTIAFAYKIHNKKDSDIKDLEKDLTFLGFMSLEDPPRDEVAASLILCKNAGINVKMITGDSKETAESIASQIGLKGKVMLGEDIDKLNHEEFSKVVKDVVIFARVRPEHKLRIVKALKENSEIVTMTGDGINDAPALKEAHIGVAMGKNGTDVSKASADLILKDNHFSTIVDAIKEGRTIFSNIQKFSAYQISINVAQVGLILLSALLGLPLPLVAIQILLMNIISDEMTALSLAFNPYSKDVMNLHPRKKSVIIDKRIFMLLMTSGIIMMLGSLFIFYYVNFYYVGIFKGESEIVARTAVFITMNLFAIVNAFNFRSFRKPISEMNFMGNKYLIVVSALSLLLTSILIYTPLNHVFEMTYVPLSYWIPAGLISLFLILVFEVVKRTDAKPVNYFDIYKI